MPLFRSQPGRGAPRSAYTVALLALTFVLVAALAYKAGRAAYRHRESAERTLREYADLAAWEYQVRSQRAITTAMVTAFGLSMSAVNPELPSDSLPTAAAVGDVARRFAAYCGCLDSVRYFFRYDWRAGALTTSGVTPTADELRWVRDTVTAHTRIFPPPPAGLAPLTYGGGPNGEQVRRLSVLLTNDAYVLVYRQVAGRERVLAYVLSRDYENRPVAVYGFESDAEAFTGRLFRQVYEREAVLPPSITRGVPVDSVLAVRVADAGGGLVFQSGTALAAPWTAVDTLPNEFGRAVVHVSLRPGLAEHLVVGGLPRTELPMLAGMVLLTGALLVGAVVQLRRQQDLVRLRSDFVSGVSHELRTPLTQIRLFAELLTSGDLRSDEQRQRAARVVDQEARRLGYLVENVLSYAKGERRAMRIARETTDVTREVRDALDFFAPVAQARGVTVRLAADERIVAPVDRAALRQILLNLLDNAVKYGPGGQTVTVTVTLADTTLRVQVDDQGRGIPREERERIWEPYHRLARDQRSAVGGSGIGLAVVRDLATLHGGSAWAEDAPAPTFGRPGARFVVELSVIKALEDPKTGEWEVMMSTSVRPSDAPATGANGTANGAQSGASNGASTRRPASS